MAIHLTRIYTKTGDDGTTALGDMSRVPKTDPRIAAYADVDETNCVLGLVTALSDLDSAMSDILRIIQNDLFDVGADLSTPIVEPHDDRLRVTEEQITALETWCDAYNDDLPKLRSFVLPGGSPAAALLHQARAVARRAERSTWELMAVDGERTNPLTAKYLNRLSDLLFIFARAANVETGDGDVLWQPGGERNSP